MSKKGKFYKNLSKNLLEMKFMKKTKEKAENDVKEQEADELFTRDGAFKIKDSNYIVEPSHVKCQNLVYGRMSYQGFNPNIERLMKGEARKVEKTDFATEKEKMENISEEEMADRYKSLINTMAKKFKRKKNRPLIKMTEQQEKRQKTS